MTSNDTTSQRPLATLATDDSRHDAIVGYRASTTVCWSQLQQRRDAWGRTVAGIEATRVALYLDDSLEFAAAVLALWRSGRTPIIPANTLPATCTALAELTDTFLGDFPVDNCLHANNAVQGSTAGAPTAEARAEGRAESPNPALILFTSGSTGDPTPIAKSFAQLDAEIATLETQWGALLGPSTITSTVPHHHIYGLLFKLLWPLATARPVLSGGRDYWEEIHRDCQRFGAVAIVSSPAHLGRLPDLDWACARDHISAIFSSGAALDAATAATAERQIGHAIVEVYGSTETGGIAWRRQTLDPRWRPFPAVRLHTDEATDQLILRSPMLPDNGCFTTNDRVRLERDNTFTLLNRVDRIVKIAGKRIALPDIERHLCRHPWVVEAVVTPLPTSGDRLGALVALTDEGNRVLIDRGRLALNEALKHALAGKVERVGLPRYWRYLASLPRNAQGKLVQAQIQSLFDSTAQPDLPECVDWRARGGDELQLRLRIPINLACFNGHFPGHPVVPGVAQIHWAVHYARTQWPGLIGFQQLEAIKFQHVIGADECLELTLNYHRAKQRLGFSYRGPKRQYSSGRITFSPAGQASPAATTHADSPQAEPA